MPKLVLLKSEKDFAAFRASKSYQSISLKIRVRINPNQNTPRFGFIIPKKLVPKVVHRNLIKRRVKSLMLKFSPKLKPVDILFFPRPQMLLKKFSELETEIALIFSNARLWKF
ncbi:MAG: ribonuclease P protein component [Candidatus Doudnabacteria bacterium]